MDGTHVEDGARDAERRGTLTAVKDAGADKLIPDGAACVGARVLLPGVLSMSRRNRAPASSCALPPLNVPRRSFGPCRSSSTPIGRLNSFSSLRMIASRSAWSACVPWLKLRRNTSTPRSNNARMACSPELAGPRGATILALRARLIMGSPFSDRLPPLPGRHGGVHRSIEHFSQQLRGCLLPRSWFSPSL